MKLLPFIKHQLQTQKLQLGLQHAQTPAASRDYVFLSKISLSNNKEFHCRKNQTGDMLIEALIGFLLMAIIAVGVTTITSKVEKSKREMSVQDLAISQLQELLLKNGNGTIDLCDATPESIVLPDETITVVATGCNKVTSTINGVSLTDLKQPIVLTATSTKIDAIFTVGGVSTQR